LDTWPRSHGRIAENAAFRFASSSVEYFAPPNAVASPPFAAYFASMKAAAFSMQSSV
jgi:hypothetical protein